MEASVRGTVMRRLAAALATTALICAGAGSTAAQSPAASPEPVGQRIELPGYGASIIVPEHWTTDIWGPGGLPLFPESQLHVDLAVVATGGPEAQQCRLIASSPATCDAPVDLSAELAAPGWDPIQLPAGEAAYRALDYPETPDVACSRYVLSDGLDVYELRCCGADRPADAWRPIADTFTFPAQSRWDSPDTDGRGLLEEVEVVWQKPGNWPVGWKQGSGDTQTAKQWINRPRNKLSKGEVAAIRAMVDVLGVPAKQVTIGERVYESEDGEVLLAVDDVRVRGTAKRRWRTSSGPSPTEVVLEGFLVWLAHDWERRYEDAPVFEELEIGGREVLAVTFGADDPTEYVLASADTAMRVRGSDTEAATTMLEALSCRHLDDYSLVREYLVERMPQRPSGANE